MKLKIIIQTILIIVIVGFVLFGVFIFDFKNNRNNISFPTENFNNSFSQEQVKVGLPVRLKIPKINVDANIEYVGTASDGSMDVPKNPDNAAWFNLGLRPGENGSAVIAGHYGWKNGKASVFDNLYKLTKGDKLFIEDDSGATMSFVVTEIRRYNPKEDASYVFSSDDGKSHLNLITCEGVWNKILGSYSKRLVVFTDKE